MYINGQYTGKVKREFNETLLQNPDYNEKRNKELKIEADEEQLEEKTHRQLGVLGKMKSSIQNIVASTTNDGEHRSLRNQSNHQSNQSLMENLTIADTKSNTTENNTARNITEIASKATTGDANKSYPTKVKDTTDNAHLLTNNKILEEINNKQHQNKAKEDASLIALSKKLNSTFSNNVDTETEKVEKETSDKRHSPSSSSSSSTSILEFLKKVKEQSKAEMDVGYYGQEKNKKLIAEMIYNTTMKTNPSKFLYEYTPTATFIQHKHSPTASTTRGHKPTLLNRITSTINPHKNEKMYFSGSNHTKFKSEENYSHVDVFSENPKEPLMDDVYENLGPIAQKNNNEKRKGSNDEAFTDDDTTSDSKAEDEEISQNISRDQIMDGKRLRMLKLKNDLHSTREKLHMITKENLLHKKQTEIQQTNKAKKNSTNIIGM